MNTDGTPVGLIPARTDSVGLAESGTLVKLFCGGKICFVFIAAVRVIPPCMDVGCG